jgi:hypothetical protein
VQGSLYPAVSGVARKVVGDVRQQGLLSPGPELASIMWSAGQMPRTASRCQSQGLEPGALWLQGTFGCNDPEPPMRPSRRHFHPDERLETVWMAHQNCNRNRDSLYLVAWNIIATVHQPHSNFGISSSCACSARHLCRMLSTSEGQPTSLYQWRSHSPAP